MTINRAISIRVRNLIEERNITQYRLEQISGISHGTMNCFLNNRYKSCNFTTVVKIISALNLTIKEFFDDPIFDINKLSYDD